MRYFCQYCRFCIFSHGFRPKLSPNWAFWDLWTPKMRIYDLYNACSQRYYWFEQIDGVLAVKMRYFCQYCQYCRFCLFFHGFRPKLSPNWAFWDLWRPRRRTYDLYNACSQRYYWFEQFGGVWAVKMRYFCQYCRFWLFATNFSTKLAQNRPFYGS